jgi:predicted DNA-binding protein YlxM (UPF0122 family)
MTTEYKVDLVLNNLKSQIESLLVLLTQKERQVVEKRFSIGTDKRFTLEEIGQEFNVTRERIRQIEKNALQKLRRNVENFDAIVINNAAHDFIVERGGICKEDDLLSHVIKSDPQLGIGAIQMILSLDKRFERLSNTIQYHPYYKLNTISEESIKTVCNMSLDYLKKSQRVATIKELYDVVKGAVSDVQAGSLKSAYSVHKSFKPVEDGVGLMEWRNIHPRTLRDKIFFVLRQKGGSMHFVDICNEIMSAQFDRKSLNMQAVHNELIRYPEFVLVGRGLYALKEWGFDHGTVADVIEDIMAAKESMSEDQIIDEVMKRRKVKAITVILNLKNKPQFERVGRKQYVLKK